jgi:5,10-methenyltetrahydrofolate synthetase
VLDDPTDAAAVTSWRKALRAKLIAQRLAATSEQHAQWSTAVALHLADFFADRDITDRVVAFCWPYNAEYDARPVITDLLLKGARTALPVVVAPRTPLVFREWRLDTPMAADVYGIPVSIRVRLRLG